MNFNLYLASKSGKQLIDIPIYVYILYEGLKCIHVYLIIYGEPIFIHDLFKKGGWKVS